MSGRGTKRGRSFGKGHYNINAIPLWHGNPFHPDSPLPLAKDGCRAAGVPKCVWHKLRNRSPQNPLNALCKCIVVSANSTSKDTTQFLNAFGIKTSTILDFCEKVLRFAKGSGTGGRVSAVVSSDQGDTGPEESGPESDRSW